MPRICGCPEETFEVKRELLKTLQENRVVDDGKQINVGMVFHIMFNGYVKTQVESDVAYTIEMLNKDYNKLNSNFNIGKGVYSDPDLKMTYDQYIKLSNYANINFYLSSIIYAPIEAQSSKDIAILDGAIKKKSHAIDSNKNLNIWVVDLTSGLLGYAQFPWDLKTKPLTDGVVIAKGTFGKKPAYPEFNLGKTLTHESGHWFGLYHTFQSTFKYVGGAIDYTDGTPEQELEETKGDCVIDTPPQKDPTYGNPFSTPTTWPTSKPIDEKLAYRHMFMNFMDYSDDIAMFMFTKDQTNKLRQMIYLYRPDILKNTIQPIQVIEPTQPLQPIEDIPKQSFVSLNHSFEYGDDDQWVSGWKLLDNIKDKTDAEISTKFPYCGSRSLRTCNSGKAELVGNLTNAKKCILSLYARPRNINTKLWVKPPGSLTWYNFKFEYATSYKNFVFELPGPFDSVNNEHYSIRIGTEGDDYVYSYFDNISIINITSLPQLTQ